MFVEIGYVHFFVHSLCYNINVGERLQDAEVWTCTSRENILSKAGGEKGRRDSTMWLNMNMDGVLFQWRIRGYRSGIAGKTGDWTRMDLRLQSKNVLNYQKIDDEQMTFGDLESLHDTLELYLSGRETDIKELESLERMLLFTFYPGEKAAMDVRMAVSIEFWIQGVSASLGLRFNRSEMKIMLYYLRLVMGEIDEQDKTVKKLLEAGVFVRKGLRKIESASKQDLFS